jgi:DNA mismatch repair protein MutS
LKEALQTYEEKNKNVTVPVLLKDIKFVTGNGKSKKIESPFINSVTRSILDYEGKLQKESSRAYENIMKEIETGHVDNLDKISLLITRLDVIQSKTYVAHQYNYSMPVLDEHTRSFVHAYDLRHVLIEHLQQDETYVPNDIFLNKSVHGEEEDGYESGNLLYGTNAVGKTSLIRALGICVIMAQCGMYVPCSKLVFKPYTGVYSRIIGNDNLFRGLSTFAVEMSELRVILKEANENSLILGDELCSGTELQSALSIFVSGLEKMYHNKSSFIFATHFHEIVNYDEIKAMNHLGIKHMEVIYNRELDELVYDRKVKDGPGTNTYGLEVCKSLHLDQDFLTRAYDIRDKYFKEFSGSLARGTSRYNAKKILGVCEMCNNELGSEVHHIEHQKDADEKGYVGSVHKNHKANLMNICEKCHDELHRNENTHLKKKKTLSGKVVLN